jgi:hypothetical protein
MSNSALRSVILGMDAKWPNGLSTNGPVKASATVPGPKLTASSRGTKVPPHHVAVRSLAFKWQRIIWRCWQNHTPYCEEIYLNALKRFMNFLSKGVSVCYAKSACGGAAQASLEPTPPQAPIER